MNKVQLAAKPGNANSSLESLLRKPESPCVSIQLVLYKLANMRKHNAGNIQKAISKVNAALEISRASQDIKKAITERLETLAAELNNDGTAESIGLFVSPRASGIIPFPFKVNEITLVADTFETRDLWYLQQYLRPYHVLSLGKTVIRLFRGMADSLEEVKNNSFPLKYTEEYEYERSSPGTSYGYAMKGFEKDKGELTYIRLQAQMREAQQHLSVFMKDASSELIVSGPSKMASDFVKSFHAKKQIAGTVENSFKGDDHPAFAKAVWAAIVDFRKKQIASSIDQLNNLGLNYKAAGLRKVWEAANTGKGKLLLVERDFQRCAYQPDGVEQIRLHPPKGKYTFIADAVDDVIEKVKSKHGQVLFTEPNQLRKFEGIALVLRYK